MAAELVAAEEFIRASCLASSALVTAVPGGFHSERQHAAKAGRYVLWTYQGSMNDTLGDHGVRIMAHPLYLLRVVDKTGSFLTLQSAADLLDQAVSSVGPTSFVIAGTRYTIQSCIRERPYTYVEHYVDIEWRHEGGYYRLDISPF